MKKRAPSFAEGATWLTISKTGYYAAPILPTLIERREILREAVLL